MRMFTLAGPGGQSLWSRIAGGSLALTGIGHLATELLAPKTPEQRAIMAALRELRVSLPGAERSVAELLLGFSLIMGVLLIGGGVLIATASATRLGRVAAVASTLGACVLCWRYLFVVPGVLTTIAALAAFIALWPQSAGHDVAQTR
jgi:hypothetical protein